MQNSFITTKPKTVTYLGVPATTFDVKKSRNAKITAGVKTWHAKAVGQPVEHEAGTVTLRVVDGDMRKGGTILHDSTHKTVNAAVAAAHKFLNEL